MSVITESREDDLVVLIGNFVTREEGEAFQWGKERSFSIGEKVAYVSEFRNPNTRQEHLAWHVRFKTPDGRCYSATQSYFVTQEAWTELELYFVNSIGTKPQT